MDAINPQEIPENPEICREWMKYQLTLRGLTIAAMAREHGVIRSTVQKVFERPYPLWEFRVAEALGTKPQLLWPERYDAYGVPCRQRGRPRKNSSYMEVNNSIKCKSCNDSNTRAA